MSEKRSTFGKAAYGGAGWIPRQSDHQNELGSHWAPYKLDNEWAPLKAVLMHRPAQELKQAQKDAEAALMLEPLALELAQSQHDEIAKIYKKHKVEVHYTEPLETKHPNLMFCADLCAMTPAGAILARPAGEARAGEERWIARRLADIGVPLLKTLTGKAVFEGADLMWLDQKTAMIGRGHRTNQAAIDQIAELLSEIGCDVITVDLPFGTMHFMGMLRIADQDLAFCWPRRTPLATVRALEERGYQVAFPPLEDEQDSYKAMNFVTLGPRKIILASGLPQFEDFFAHFDIEIETVNVDELAKAAGNIGCLTSILWRC